MAKEGITRIRKFSATESKKSAKEEYSEDEIFYYGPGDSLSKNDLVGIKKLVIQEGIRRLDTEAISSSKIEEVILPESLKRIDSTTFYLCKKLSRINSDVDGVFNIPEDVRLDDSVFDGCESLREIKLY